MKFTINKRLAALVLATAVVSSQFQTVAFATANINIDNYENQGEEYKEIYTNDFSNDEKPNEVGGVITNEDVSIEDEMLKGIAAKYNKSVGQVILRWNVQRGVVVIPKSTHVERIKENIDIFDFELNEEEMKQISSLDMGYSGSRAKHFEPDFVRMVLNNKIHD